MMRLRPYFPLGRGRARVDDKRVLSGIILFNRIGRGGVSLPKKNSYKTFYNHQRQGAECAGIRADLGGVAAKAPENKTFPSTQITSRLTARPPA